jgi:hypothetical protein
LICWNTVCPEVVVDGRTDHCCKAVELFVSQKERGKIL